MTLGHIHLGVVLVGFPDLRQSLRQGFQCMGFIEGMLSGEVGEGRRKQDGTGEEAKPGCGATPLYVESKKVKLIETEIEWRLPEFGVDGGWRDVVHRVQTSSYKREYILEV